MNENDLFNFQLEYTFTADWLAELDRQLALLLSTREGTMPLDRAFGLNMDFVDMPPEAAKSLYTAEVTEKVSKFIPEVRVQEVSWIGGNTGNQTITMIVRAMALQQIQPGSFTFLILREMGVALINGLVWGGIMGAITWWLYDDPQLGGVMTLAMMLNLLMAAMMGVIIPMVMVKLGRDPAVGSSVMITAITDTGGFFIFLGLATLFLM